MTENWQKRLDETEGLIGKLWWTFYGWMMSLFILPLVLVEKGQSPWLVVPAFATWGILVSRLGWNCLETARATYTVHSHAYGASFWVFALGLSWILMSLLLIVDRFPRD